VFLAAVACSALAAGSQAEDEAAAMGSAASDLVRRLGTDQAGRAVLAFDEETRADWHFIPKPERKGLPLKDMGEDQKHLAHALLSASLGRHGYGKATRIMSLETVLRQMETDAGATHPFVEMRDPGNYWVSFFGDPGGDDAWGWSLEGHHLSLNFTVVDGRIASSPAFFGANPHEVPEGPAKGIRVLAAEEDLGRALLLLLDGAQRAEAVLSDQAPNDIYTSAERQVAFEEPPRGLSAARMTEPQRAALAALVEVYAANVPPGLAARRRAQFEQADPERIFFAWMGATEKQSGAAHYYRVQTPSFLIEYDNVQNGANHSHTVWRDYAGDFGRDLLGEHHRRAHD
jgi:hypothetical protein